MQKITGFLLFVFISALGLRAYADEPFYIELGSAASQEEAANRWEDLVKEHRDQLGGLQFYPVVIPETQSSISLRILGGPIETKEEAQKICHALFKKKTQCFVVEGMESPEKVANRRAAEEKKRKTEAKPQSLPWLAEEVKKQEAPKEKTGFWGRLFGDDEPNENTIENTDIEVAEPVNLSPREAKVEVAEAIPVPMSNVSTQARPDFQNDLVEEEPAEPTKPAGDVKVETVGWLMVEKFDTEDNASAFWQNARGRNASLAAGLRVRIARPLMARRENNVTLNIGPFGSESDAINFCEQAIKSIDALLNCKFTINEPKKAASSLSEYDRSNEYNRRRQRIATKRESTPYTQLLKIEAYWVQIVNSQNEGEALEQWEKIKSDNADLLRDYPSRISSSLGNRRNYNVKIGPIEMGADAEKLCSDLQQRGVSCKILSNK